MLEFISDNLPVDYLKAIAHMQSRIQNIYEEKESELIWFLEHPSLYTAGTSSKAEHFLNKYDFPLYQSSRGGQHTYHGPGQLVVYCMLDLRKRGQDIKKYVYFLENWVISTLAAFNINVIQREGRIGLWYVKSNNQEAKIASIGVRVTKWITWHGFSININPCLDHFRGIIPCGISEYGVTSLFNENYLIPRPILEEELKKRCPFM